MPEEGRIMDAIAHPATANGSGEGNLMSNDRTLINDTLLEGNVDHHPTPGKYGEKLDIVFETLVDASDTKLATVVEESEETKTSAVSTPVPGPVSEETETEGGEVDETAASHTPSATPDISAAFLAFCGENPPSKQEPKYLTSALDANLEELTKQPVQEQPPRSTIVVKNGGASLGASGPMSDAKYPAPPPMVEELAPLLQTPQRDGSGSNKGRRTVMTPLTALEESKERSTPHGSRSSAASTSDREAGVSSETGLSRATSAGTTGGSIPGIDGPIEYKSDETTAKEVFVANIDYSTTEEELARLFDQCGRVMDVTLPMNPGGKTIRGIGFITFSEESAVPRAIEMMDGVQIHGRAIQVRRNKGKVPLNVKQMMQKRRVHQQAYFPLSRSGRRPPLDSNTAFVGNLPFTTTSDELLDLVEQSCHVPVHACRIVLNEQKTSRGFGYVDLFDLEAVEIVLDKLNGLLYQGRIIRADYASGFIDKSKSRRGPRMSATPSISSGLSMASGIPTQPPMSVSPPSISAGVAPGPMETTMTLMNAINNPFSATQAAAVGHRSPYSVADLEALNRVAPAVAAMNTVPMGLPGLISGGGGAPRNPYQAGSMANSSVAQSLWSAPTTGQALPSISMVSSAMSGAMTSASFTPAAAMDKVSSTIAPTMTPPMSYATAPLASLPKKTVMGKVDEKFSDAMSEVSMGISDMEMSVPPPMSQGLASSVASSTRGVALGAANPYAASMPPVPEPVQPIVYTEPVWSREHGCFVFMPVQMGGGATTAAGLTGWQTM